MDNKWIWKFVLYSVIIMLLFPVLTNGLMFVGDFKVAGDDKTWIGYLGSFWGAIIGGIISGTITLIGVRMTILNQKNEEFMRIYPQLMLNGDEITKSLRHFLQDMNGDNLDNSYIAEIVKKYETLSAELLMKAVNINGFVYDNYKNIDGHFYYFKKYINDNASYNDGGILEYDLDDVEIKYYIKLITDDLKKHINLILEISNTFYELTVVDRAPKKWKRKTRKYLKKAKKELEK